MTEFYALILGAILSWLILQYQLARSEETALLTDHIKDIEKLADAALEYWTREYSEAAEELILSARVRAAHVRCSRSYPQVARICYKREFEYKAAFSDLYEAATGGDFESKLRSAEPDRAAQSFEKASELIDVLRKSRGEAISIQRLVRPLYLWLMPESH